MKRILVATAEPGASEALARAFSEGARLEAAEGPGAMRDRLARARFDILFVDVSWLSDPSPVSAEDHHKALTAFWVAHPAMEIIVMARAERVRDAVKSVKAGADNYLTYPLDPVEASFVVESLMESRKIETQLDYFRDATRESDAGIVTRTKSPAMKAVFEKALMVASTGSTVLLSGETGTGKGVVARLIHARSPRADGVFVAVHCGAIPDTLIESELFGHEKGAFTGASKQKPGKFEIASGGSIFLDEVGTISLPAQIKLLQVLQDKVFQRLGGQSDIPMTARVIAAANTDLKAQCDRGEFRADLYYRLNVFPIEIPPLRQRKEDLELLADSFLKKLARQYGREPLGLHPHVLEALQAYEWPGNVRELENLLERAFILETSHILTPESFPAELMAAAAPVTNIPVDISLPLAEFRNQAKDNAERHYLKELLAANAGRVGKSAEMAGVTPRQLHKLMTRHGIHKEEFKRREKAEE